MNPALYTSESPCSRHDDDEEWLGGEAWVIPQPFAIASFGVGDVVRVVDPADDWVPL